MRFGCVKIVWFSVFSDVMNFWLSRVLRWHTIFSATIESKKMWNTKTQSYGVDNSISNNADDELKSSLSFRSNFYVAYIWHNFWRFSHLFDQLCWSFGRLVYANAKLWLRLMFSALGPLSQHNFLFFRFSLSLASSFLIVDVLFSVECELPKSRK